MKKHLRIATADHPKGSYRPAGLPFTGDWVEGPSVVQWGGQFHVYFDHYVKPQYCGAARSPDLLRWEDISKQVSLPTGARHGTDLAVSESVVRRLEMASRRP